MDIYAEVNTCHLGLQDHINKGIFLFTWLLLIQTLLWYSESIMFLLYSMHFISISKVKFYSNLTYQRQLQLYQFYAQKTFMLVTDINSFLHLILYSMHVACISPIISEIILFASCNLFFLAFNLPFYQNLFFLTVSWMTNIQWVNNLW